MCERDVCKIPFKNIYMSHLIVMVRICSYVHLAISKKEKKRRCKTRREQSDFPSSFSSHQKSSDIWSCGVKALTSIKTVLSPVSNTSGSKIGGNGVAMTEAQKADAAVLSCILNPQGNSTDTRSKRSLPAPAVLQFFLVVPVC